MNATQPHLLHPKYRPDIDGLRALAVLAVVIFHAFPEKLPGGFIGVDIFFVISGYLISSIILENLNKGIFRFSEFYARRIKRIFPALTLVLIFCLAFGWFALLPDEYKQLGKHVAGGATFVANYVLWKEAGYFDNSADTKPLLHLWSLGIEEQFYIIWPLLLWLAFRKRFNLLSLCIALVFISFYYSIKTISVDSVAAFYAAQCRFWELIIGSILAWTKLNSPDRNNKFAEKINNWLTALIFNNAPENNDNKTSTLTDVISFLGFIFCIYGFWGIDKNIGFPGKWALIPVVGSVMLIHAGPKAWINRTILSNKLVIWFGLISFPLYLWHWPLLSMLRITESVTPDANIRLLAVLLAILLAWLTYRLLERPVRLGGNSTIKVTALSLLMIVIAYTGYNVYHRDGLSFRSAAKEAQINRFGVHYKQSCEKLTGEAFDDDWCNAGTQVGQAVTVVMVGDSYSNAYSTMLNAYAKNTPGNFSFVQFARGQCPALLDYGPPYCRFITEKAFNYIKTTESVKTVVMASNWPAYYHGKDFQWVKYIESPENFKIALGKTIEAYRNIGKNVIIFLPPPQGSNPKACIKRPLRISNIDSCNITLQYASAIEAGYRDYFIPFLESQHIPYFDPFKFFCNGSICKVTENGKIFSVDGGHMSQFGGEFLQQKGLMDLKILFPVNQRSTASVEPSVSQRQP